MKAINKVLYDEYSKRFFGNVHGNMIPIGGGNSDDDTDNGAIITVDTLPREGEVGKIYYNTTDDKYYIYDSATHEYTDLSAATIEVIDDIDDVETVDLSPEVNTYRLRPGVFYNIDDWNKGDESDTALVFVFERGNGIFAGRFTAWADDMTLTWPTSVDVVDADSLEIVSDHTYEFNVWLGKCIIKDVTGGE